MNDLDRHRDDLRNAAQRLLDLADRARADLPPDEAVELAVALMAASDSADLQALHLAGDLLFRPRGQRRPARIQRTPPAA